MFREKRLVDRQCRTVRASYISDISAPLVGRSRQKLEHVLPGRLELLEQLALSIEMWGIDNGRCWTDLVAGLIFSTRVAQRDVGTGLKTSPGGERWSEKRKKKESDRKFTFSGPEIRAESSLQGSLKTCL